MVRSLESQGSS